MHLSYCKLYSGFRGIWNWGILPCLFEEFLGCKLVEGLLMLILLLINKLLVILCLIIKRHIFYHVLDMGRLDVVDLVIPPV